MRGGEEAAATLPRASAETGAARRPPFVLVTGGKGGVGKTTLAANLGVELAGAGLAPLLADLDFGLADLAVVLRLEATRDVEDFFARRLPLEECLADGPGGVRVLPAGAGRPVTGEGAGADGPSPSSWIGAERCHRLLDALARPAPPGALVLGDSPAGIGPDVLEFAVHADRVLVVTTPEPAALTDAYSVVKALDARARDEALDVPTPDLFVNLAADAAEAREAAGRLRAACARFLSRSPRLVGWMPRSRGVLRCARRQEPFVLTDPRSPAARALRQLARRFALLAGGSGGPPPPARAPGPPAKAPAADDR